jgi:hypothetical protein
MHFNIKEIPNIIAEQMKAKGVWKTDCPVNLERLKLLEISHVDFEGNIRSGEIIVLDKLAESVIRIFKELMVIKFPIHSVYLIDKYEGDDDRSMAANNSSSFNFRKIANSTQLSMHAYGLAIDINPVQNPYIVIQDDGHVEVYPKAGVEFLNRTNLRPGMVEPIVPIFKKYGFSEWGGNWNKPIDYHHFQLSRLQLHELI